MFSPLTNLPFLPLLPNPVVLFIFVLISGAPCRVPEELDIPTLHPQARRFPLTTVPHSSPFPLVLFFLLILVSGVSRCLPEEFDAARYVHGRDILAGKLEDD